MSEDSENINDSNAENVPNANNSEEYAYLDRGGFSSEKFKIEVRGLPKFYGIAVRIIIYIYNLLTNNILIIVYTYLSY